jgi:hypothetical protein
VLTRGKKNSALASPVQVHVALPNDSARNNVPLGLLAVDGLDI